MISVGIIGGSGYTGKKLVQFCNNHPYVEAVKVYGFTTAGEQLDDLFPELNGLILNSYVESIENLSELHDVYFIALPHGEALKYVPDLIKKGKKVIDLGGDYRLNSKEVYEKWYKVEHNSAELLESKIYGLADYSGTDYSSAQLIANPGCYPTATNLALLPFVTNYSDDIISIGTSAYSGTSGAGKAPKSHLMLSEMDGNVTAYNVSGHRHQPEIMQTINSAGNKAPYSFTTHLLPVAVGIYSTNIIHLNKKLDEDEVKEFYKSFYIDSKFVRLRNKPPQLNWVTGTNFCDINVTVNDEVAIVTSAIDNLTKGASGQAVQNLNKIFGWDETLGIINTRSNYVSVY